MTGASGSPQTDDRAEGLLDQIAAQALDDDYYLVHAEPPRRWQRAATGVAAGVFGLMVTVAAVQTQVDRPATERQQQTLASDVAKRREQQQARSRTLAALRAEVADLTASADRDDPAQQALLVRTAGSAVRGPGIVVKIEPAATDGGQGDVSDDDLQTLANALWYLGAEAVSINGERLGTQTSIRTAGEAVTVNYQSINPPYVLRAIGPAEQLEERLEQSRLGRDWRDRSRLTTLGYSVRQETDLRLDPIDAGRLEISHARPFQEAS